MSRSLVLERGRQHEAALRLRDPRRIISPVRAACGPNSRGLRSGCCRAVTGGSESGTPIPGPATGRSALLGAATFRDYITLAPPSRGAELAPIPPGRFEVRAHESANAAKRPTWCGELSMSSPDSRWWRWRPARASSPRSRLQLPVLAQGSGASLRGEIFPTGSVRHQSADAHPHQRRLPAGRLDGVGRFGPALHWDS